MSEEEKDKIREIVGTFDMDIISKHIDQYANEKLSAMASEIKDGCKLALMTNKGEVHEDFGETWRTKNIDSKIDGILAKHTKQ